MTISQASKPETDPGAFNILSSAMYELDPKRHHAARTKAAVALLRAVAAVADHVGFPAAVTPAGAECTVGGAEGSVTLSVGAGGISLFVNDHDEEPAKRARLPPPAIEYSYSEGRWVGAARDRDGKPTSAVAAVAQRIAEGLAKLRNG